jgi:hypothetical protein
LNLEPCLTRISACLQGFFSALPRAIAARVRASPCIPTEQGSWVTPAEAAVCSSPPVRALLSLTSRLLHGRASAGGVSPDANVNEAEAAVTQPRENGQPTVKPEAGTMEGTTGAEPGTPALESELDTDLAQLMGLHLAHPSLTSLHTSELLRSLLGVRDFSPARLVELARSIASRGLLPRLGVPWVAQLLVVTLSLIDAPSGAQGAGYSAGGSGLGVSREQMLAELRALPIYPVKSGGFTSLAPSGSGGEGQQGTGRPRQAAGGYFFYPSSSPATPPSSSSSKPAGSGPACGGPAITQLLQASGLGPVDELQGLALVDTPALFGCVGPDAHDQLKHALQVSCQKGCTPQGRANHHMCLQVVTYNTSLPASQFWWCLSAFWFNFHCRPWAYVSSTPRTWRGCMSSPCCAPPLLPPSLLPAWRPSCASHWQQGCWAHPSNWSAR